VYFGLMELEMEAQLVREHAMNPLRRTEHGWDIQEVDSEAEKDSAYAAELEKPLFENVEIDFSPLYLFSVLSYLLLFLDLIPMITQQIQMCSHP
jgi:hypothetical protein